MKPFLRRRPSPALVISLIALFVSLSGVSYGVATGFIDSREIKNNQVRTRDLRNNDIRTKDLRNNEVRGLDIRRSTIQGSDVALNTLGGDDVAESKLGKVPSATSADTATQRHERHQRSDAERPAHGRGQAPQRQRDQRGRPRRGRPAPRGHLRRRQRGAAGEHDRGGRRDRRHLRRCRQRGPACATRRHAVVHNLDDSFSPGDDFDLQDTPTASDDRIFQLHYLSGTGADVTAQLITDDDLGANNCIVSGYAVVSG